MAVSGHLTKHEELLSAQWRQKCQREQLKEKRDFILLCDFIGARPQGSENILERIVYA